MCIFLFFCTIVSDSLIHGMLGNLILALFLIIIAFAVHKVYMCLWKGSGGVVCAMVRAMARTLKML